MTVEEYANNLLTFYNYSVRLGFCKVVRNNNTLITMFQGDQMLKSRKLAEYDENSKRRNTYTNYRFSHFELPIAASFRKYTYISPKLAVKNINLLNNFLSNVGEYLPTMHFHKNRMYFELIDVDGVIAYRIKIKLFTFNFGAKLKCLIQS
jgi:hypothetical protein